VRLTIESARIRSQAQNSLTKVEDSWREERVNKNIVELPRNIEAIMR
jgi:hypothetical protein